MGRQFSISHRLFSLLLIFGGFAQICISTSFVAALDITDSVESTITLGKKEKPILCGKTSNLTWILGRMKAAKKKSDSPSFIAVTEDIKRIKKQLRIASSSTAERLTKKLITLRKIKKLGTPECVVAGAEFDNNRTAPAPIASNGSATGNALDPIAVTLSVDSIIPNATLTCATTSVDSNISVEVFENCTALVKPLSHRVGTASFQFKATRTNDNQESNVATVTVSWDQSGNFIGDQYSLAKYKDSLSVDEARYLARWAGLGDNIEAAVQIGTQPGGLDALVNNLLTPSSPDCPQIEQQAIDSSWIDKWPYCQYDGSVNGGTMFCTPDSQAGRVQWNSYALNHYFLYHLRYNCNPLRERIALFWQNHFPADVNSLDGTQSPWSQYGKDYLDLTRANVPEAQGSLFTRFDTMVSHMHGKTGSMLRYLNNIDNIFTTGGNENYARELLELFTLGVNDVVTNAPNYTEQHVYDTRYAVMGYTETPEIQGSVQLCCNTGCPYASCTTCGTLDPEDQCRTGNYTLYKPSFSDTRWNFPNQPISTTLFRGTPWERFAVWKANIFDPGEDNFTPYLLNDVPGVARYLAARLIATFAGTDITEEMLQPVVQALRDNNFDITEALRIILSSSSFFSATNRYDGITEPVETYVSFIRAIGLPMARTTSGSSYSDLFGTLRNVTLAAGQRLFIPPSVFGWPAIGKITGGVIHNGKAFASVQRWLERWRGIAQYLNEVNRSISFGLNFSWTQLLPPAPQNQNPNAVLDHILNKLGMTVPPETRAKLYAYLTTVVTQRTNQNGIDVPNTSFQFTIDWSTLTSTQLTELWSIKGPGLLTILFTLPENNLR